MRNETQIELEEFIRQQQKLNTVILLILASCIMGIVLCVHLLYSRRSADASTTRIDASSTNIIQ